MRIAANLFAAGQETTVRLLGAALQLLGRATPSSSSSCATDRDRIPNFVEEMLRIESPVKGDFRLARVADDRRRRRHPGRHDGDGAATAPRTATRAASSDPAEFRVDAANARQHIAFGRGIHTCPGAPLARAEARISLERILDRMGDIRISEAEHGPAGDRRYDVRADVHPARPHPAAPRVHACHRVPLSGSTARE